MSVRSGFRRGLAAVVLVGSLGLLGACGSAGAQAGGSSDSKVALAQSLCSAIHQLEADVARRASLSSLKADNATIRQANSNINAALGTSLGDTGYNQTFSANPAVRLHGYVALDSECQQAGFPTHDPITTPSREEFPDGCLHRAKHQEADKEGSVRVSYDRACRPVSGRGRGAFPTRRILLPPIRPVR